jgi:diguanylate cyclase
VNKRKPKTKFLAPEAQPALGADLGQAAPQGAAGATSRSGERRGVDPVAVANSQDVRLRRFYSAGGFSAMYTAMVAVFWLVGLVDTPTLAGAVGFVLISSIAFYTLISSGWNIRLREPSMTLPLTMTAIATMLVVMFFAPATQIIYAPFTFGAMAFSALRLSGRTLMAIGLCAVLGNCVVVALHYLLQDNQASLQLELLHLLVLAVTLPVFALLAIRIRSLSHALASAGAKIESIEKSAQRDPLTGCYNRKFVFAKLEELRRKADQNDQPLCLAVLDIDHFKDVNDTVGHLGGDAVLRSFSQLCSGAVRDDDVFGRYGGEEFLLILPATSLLSAQDTCERIRALVERHHWRMPGHNPVTVSIGVTRYAAPESALEFFSRTDAAMYAAKQGGRNQVVIQEHGVHAKHRQAAIRQRSGSMSELGES